MQLSLSSLEELNPQKTLTTSSFPCSQPPRQHEQASLEISPGEADGSASQACHGLSGRPTSLLRFSLNFP